MADEIMKKLLLFLALTSAAIIQSTPIIIDELEEIKKTETDEEKLKKCLDDYEQVLLVALIACNNLPDKVDHPLEKEFLETQKENCKEFMRKKLDQAWISYGCKDVEDRVKKQSKSSNQKTSKKLFPKDFDDELWKLMR